MWLSSLRRSQTSISQRGRAQHRLLASRFRPWLEALENRCLPSTLTVTSSADTGPGSLRYAIWGARSGDTIVFAPNNVYGRMTITLNRELAINKSLTIQGGGLVTITCYITDQDRVFDVFTLSSLHPTPVQVTLSGLTIEGGHGLGSQENAYGGGIFNSATLTVSNCLITNNRCNLFGGGIANSGTLTVSGCTFLGNSGGIFNGFLGGTPGNASLTNCTFSNNGGSGLFLDRGTTTTVTNCTFANNRGPGIGINHLGGTLNLTNTIAAGNTGGDIVGAVTTADHNLVGDGTGSTGIVNGVNGNIVGGNGNPVINADLGPLQNNGGPTQTMALLTGSPAIGHADNSKAPATDQRGVTRLDTAGETTDIGAFELTGTGSASAPTFRLTTLATAPGASIPVNTVPAAEVTSGNVGNADAHVDMVPFNNTDSAVGRTSDAVLRTTARKSGNHKTETAVVDELFLRLSEASELIDIGAFEL
jgi:parallel beta-helix repeat protein